MLRSGADQQPVVQILVVIEEVGVLGVNQLLLRSNDHSLSERSGSNLHPWNAETFKIAVAISLTE